MMTNKMFFCSKQYEIFNSIISTDGAWNDVMLLVIISITSLSSGNSCLLNDLIV